MDPLGGNTQSWAVAFTIYLKDTKKKKSPDEEGGNRYAKRSE